MSKKMPKKKETWLDFFQHRVVRRASKYGLTKEAEMVEFIRDLRKGYRMRRPGFWEWEEREPELARALDRLIPLLDPVSEGFIANAIGGIERYDELVLNLKHIRDKARKSEVGPGSGRWEDKTFFWLAEQLVDYWERNTGKKFSQSHPTKWRSAPGKKGKTELVMPNNPGLRFVYDMVSYIDHDKLGQLPSVTPDLTHARKAKKALRHPPAPCKLVPKRGAGKRST
jgi:hypothetical protein